MFGEELLHVNSTAPTFRTNQIGLVARLQQVIENTGQRISSAATTSDKQSPKIERNLLTAILDNNLPVHQGCNACHDCEFMHDARQFKAIGVVHIIGNQVSARGMRRWNRWRGGLIW